MAREYPGADEQFTPVVPDDSDEGGYSTTEEVWQRELERERFELEQERAQPTEEQLISWNEADDYRNETSDWEDEERYYDEQADDLLEQDYVDTTWGQED